MVFEYIFVLVFPLFELAVSGSDQHRHKCLAAMADASEEDKAVLQSTRSLPLAELTASTCGIGTWILRVVQPRVIEYAYMWQSQQRQGKKAECMLLSEDSKVYCMCVVKCSGSSATADKNFQAQVEKFKN